MLEHKDSGKTDNPSSGSRQRSLEREISRPFSTYQLCLVWVWNTEEESPHFRPEGSRT